jgi:glycosyltransferase involved in cell wall biosynthesis
MPTLGLSMIVKNEAQTIAPCIESAREIASQIVIADTGSTDGTVEIARKLGATVIFFPWRDHFADARNAALAPVTTDWILSLDADEELDRSAVSVISRLMRKKEVTGWILPVRNYTPASEIRAGDAIGRPNDSRHPRASTAGSYFLYQKCRLFRRQPNVYFTGRVHEQVEISIHAAKLQLRSADCCIHNFGLLSSRDEMGQKLTYYRDLLRLRVQEEPDDFRGWTYLGRMEYDSFNDRGEALRNFQKALELNPRCVEALLFTAMIYLDLGRAQDALPFLEFNPPNDASALQKQRLQGDAFAQSGQLREARTAYGKALELRSGDTELESKLGLIEVRLGLAEEGIRRLEAAACTSPRKPEVHDRLMKAYIVANMLPKAATAAESLAVLAPNPKAFLRAASIWAQVQGWRESTRLLRRGLDLFPNAPELQGAYSESLSKSAL